LWHQYQDTNFDHRRMQKSGPCLLEEWVEKENVVAD